jgi:hypothetical protein
MEDSKLLLWVIARLPSNRGCISRCASNNRVDGAVSETHKQARQLVLQSSPRDGFQLSVYGALLLYSPGVLIMTHTLSDKTPD